MSCRTAEVALGAVLVDSHVEAAYRRFGVDFAVGLECVDKRVGGVIGFLQVARLDARGLFKCLAGFGIYSWARHGQSDLAVARADGADVRCWFIRKALAA